MLSREYAYHGTSMGALAVTGLSAIKHDFEPLPPGGIRVPNTNFYRAPEFVADDEAKFGVWAADEIERAILREDAESVAAVFLEPVQNSGGCFTPPPGYFQRVREICDKYGVLLVSDEVICAFGRLGYYFGSERYGYQPDIITFAKGVTSGYSPLGGMIVRDELMEPFLTGNRHVPARHHVRRAPGVVRGRARQPGRLRAGQPARQRAGQRGRLPRHPGEAAATCRSSATSAAPATSTASSWSRTRTPRRRSTTTSPSGCCAASCRTRCSTPAWSAAPTTAATR